MDNKILQIAFFILLTIPVCAQKSTEDKPFLAYLINKEYSVYLRINFYEQDIKVLLDRNFMVRCLAIWARSTTLSVGSLPPAN